MHTSQNIMLNVKINFVNDYWCQKWLYPAVKKLPGLLRGIISKHAGDFFCLNCIHSYSTKKRLEKHEKVCNDHDYFHVKMPNEDNKILKYNHGETSMKVPLIIYADLECFLEKNAVMWQQTPKNLIQKKVYAYTFWLFVA